LSTIGLLDNKFLRKSEISPQRIPHPLARIHRKTKEQLVLQVLSTPALTCQKWQNLVHNSTVPTKKQLSRNSQIPDLKMPRKGSSNLLAEPDTTTQAWLVMPLLCTLPQTEVPKTTDRKRRMALSICVNYCPETTRQIRNANLKEELSQIWVKLPQETT